MKSKKLVLPAMILTITILAMTVFCCVTNIAKTPTITEHDFPFSITYELDGKTETFEGVYAVSFVRNGGYVNVTGRIYEGTMISSREDADTSIVLREDENGSISLYTHFHPDYLMGDPAYDTYYDHYAFEPALYYYDTEYQEYGDAETLAAHGAKLISWEYPEPIENSFVFSHIAHLSGEVVIPLVLMAVAALLAVILLVKKDPDFVKQRHDSLSVALNFLIVLILVPFTTIYACLSDINGSSAEFFHQLGYLIPSITLLGIAASVSLRRRGLSKGGLLVQLIGPAIFAFMLLCMLLQ